MTILRFEVDGEPVGKGRPRFARAGAGVRTYTPSKTKSYEQVVAMQAKAAMAGRPLIEGPVSVALYVYVQIPKSWSKAKQAQALKDQIMPTSRPDIDNVLKLVMDALNGVVWADDKQAVDVVVRKRYSDSPKVAVEVCAL